MPFTMTSSFACRAIICFSVSFLPPTQDIFPPQSSDMLRLNSSSLACSSAVALCLYSFSTQSGTFDVLFLDL